MELYGDPWAPRQLVPLREVDLSRYDLISDKEDPGADLERDKRHAEQWYACARLIDTRGPNVADPLPCPIDCPDCEVTDLETEFTAAGEDLYDVVERLRAVIKSGLGGSHHHAAAACLLQRVAHQCALARTRPALIAHTQLYSGTSLFRQIAPVRGPWSRLPFLTKVYDLQKVELPWLWSMGLNEILVGLYATNPLSAHVPNFRHIYAAFADQSSVDGHLFADKRKWRLHAMVEHINGVDYDTWSRRNTNDPSYWEKATSVLIQVLLALAVAMDHCEFSHNDLHTGNVIVEELDEPRRIAYRLRNGRTFTITAPVIARIIDYDSSHAALRVPPEFFDRVAATGVQCLDRERGVFHTGTLTHICNLAPNEPNTLYDVARFTSTWLLDTYPPSGASDGTRPSPANPKDDAALRAWLLAPLFGGKVIDMHTLHGWVRNASCTPVGVTISLLEYIDHVLDNAPYPIAYVDVGYPCGEDVKHSEGEGENDRDRGAGLECSLESISPTLARMTVHHRAVAGAELPLYPSVSELKSHPCESVRSACASRGSMMSYVLPVLKDQDGGILGAVRHRLGESERERLLTALRHERAYGPMPRSERGAYTALECWYAVCDQPNAI